MLGVEEAAQGFFSISQGFEFHRLRLSQDCPEPDCLSSPYASDGSMKSPDDMAFCGSGMFYNIAVQVN